MTNYQFETPEPVDLYVAIKKGEVDINATDTTTTTITIDGQHADEVEVHQDGHVVSVVAPKSLGGLFGDSYLSVHVEVPRGSDAVTKTGSADVSLSGTFRNGSFNLGSGDLSADEFEGSLDVATGSGDVSVNRSQGDLRVKSGSGDVELGTADGNVVVSTGSGDISIRESHGKTVIKTGSGDLTMVESIGDVSMATGSGDVKIGAARRGKLSVKGASSDVEVSIPAGLPVWTNITTLSGSIESNLQGAGQPGEGQDYLELAVTTVSGAIILNEF